MRTLCYSTLGRSLFVDNTSQCLALPEDQPALVLFDHFKGQLTEGITTELEENFIHSVIIPANFTETYNHYTFLLIRSSHLF